MILVTGATGILGRVIVIELLKKGASVRAAKRISSDLEEVRRSFRWYTENPDDLFRKIEWVEVDFECQESLQNALTDVTEVYHTSAFVSFNPKDAREMYHTNIDGTKQLLYACENSSVKKFCFISSIAVLDGLNEKGEMDEDSDYNSKLEHSPYAVSKQFSEMEAWRASAEGLEVVILNPGMIIGSGNWHKSSGQLFSTFINSRFTFSGGSAYVDVRDVAAIAVQVMEGNIFNERFIAVSENLHYSDFGKMVRKPLGLPDQKILPPALLTFGRFLNIALGWLIPPLRMITAYNISALTTFHPVSAQKVKNRLGFTFIPVKESVSFHLRTYLEDHPNIKS